MRLLGRWQVPGCCKGAREGRPGPDCPGGESMTARYAKRMEQRQVREEIEEGLHEEEDQEPAGGRCHPEER